MGEQFKLKKRFCECVTVAEVINICAVCGLPKPIQPVAEHIGDSGTTHFVGDDCPDGHEPITDEKLLKDFRVMGKLGYKVRLTQSQCLGIIQALDARDARIKELEFENKCVNELCERRRLEILELDKKVEALTEKLRVAQEALNEINECANGDLGDEDGGLFEGIEFLSWTALNKLKADA